MRQRRRIIGIITKRGYEEKGDGAGGSGGDMLIIIVRSEENRLFGWICHNVTTTGEGKKAREGWGGGAQ